MGKLSKVGILVCLLIGTNVYAQNRDLDTVLTVQTDRVQRLVQNNLGVLTNSEKREVRQVLRDTLVTIRNIVKGGAPAPVSRMSCRWFDGESQGIGQRGHHLVEEVRGIVVSREFHGNNGNPSIVSCYDSLIDLTIHPADLTAMKEDTCSCKWLDGEALNNPAERGYHMTYKVPLQNGSSVIELNKSAQFYGNGGNRSLQRCQAALVNTHFSCQL